MSALIALLLLILWVVIGIILGRLLHRLFKLDAKWRSLVVSLVVLAPFIQEVAGRLQFSYLCNKYAVVWLSPDWQKVKAARIDHSIPDVGVKWVLIPIRIQHTAYLDAESRQTFMRVTGLHTNGGIFLDSLGLGLGTTTSCWPSREAETEIRKMINIVTLLQKGEIQ